MLKAVVRGGIGASEYFLVALVMGLPVIAAAFGHAQPVEQVYGHILENVTGVVLTLGK